MTGYKNIRLSNDKRLHYMLTKAQATPALWELYNKYTRTHTYTRHVAPSPVR